jgi:flagellar M-ring protein FliF
MKDIQALLEAALGLDSKRGDRLVMVYIPDMPVQEKTTVVETPVSSNPAMNMEPPALANDEGALPWTQWGGVGLLVILLVGLLMLFTKGRRKSTAVPVVPRMSSVDREQLLVDLRRWLLEGR